ncbi:hypothetical protein ZYGR_0H03220 [Zygosaccharomyces rouxii]|uniref:ZYRO0B11484p n=2 Tax=Zygosaccharomyces rouxii TaxID=4956 RepID=C5DRU8_ZYGRC|nr:uncharacterized protein ZYRO0B11484g [Zygosaccharomyces rouxii]KAH9199961.1 hypothetical protein LQ764DRAFT_111219 [Zygosaccharomyces rouxii]GAV47479.1 hypothetical protein ZYGR_0H03220 [Zygosaccharomyces rouxii]CAR26509.1 ZYRO0B11484p [Zygosaccharomyces rouxii]
MDTSAFVKQLGSNSKPIRDNALEKLQKYLTSKPAKQSKQMQYNKLWKGLYFAMWFSDRPRPQQRLANELAELHMLYLQDKNKNKDDDELTLNDQAFIKFSRAFWKIMVMEWLQIDRYRLDKYLLLMRRVLYNQLKYLQSRDWSSKLVDTYLEKVMKRIPLSGSPKVSNGIPIHIMDILLDEWQRLFEGEQQSQFVELLSETPLKSFLAIFKELLSNVDNSKVLRNKIKRDFLRDERWGQWGIDVGLPKKADKDGEEEDDDEEEAEEWHGF